MSRLHPQDLRAIVAALVFQHPEANAKTARILTDGLLDELARTEKPEPGPGFACYADAYSAGAKAERTRIIFLLEAMGYKGVRTALEANP